MKKGKQLNSPIIPFYKGDENIFWFTLVELVVWITISMLLMVSIGVFVSTWMSNITLQKKVLDDNKKFSSDILYLEKNVLNSKKYISNIWSYTGILLRQNKYFDKWGFSYIWIKEFDKKYCEDWEITKTNHLYVSNFIPLTWVSIDTWNNNWDYKSDIKKHQILKKISWNWEVVVWKDIFWDKFSEWDFWTGVFLNSPTGLVDIDWKIVFSDTLNDRILYLSGSQVYTLLDEKDWLNEPIWLAYNSTQKALYIANAGAGEILKLSSKKYSSNPNLTLSWITKSSINKVELEILETSEVLTNPTDKSKINFDNITKNSNDKLELDNNQINYYFVWNYWSESSQSDCKNKNNWDIIFDYPNKVIYCTDWDFFTWTWKLASFRKVNFNNTKLTIDNIEPLLSENKSYYIKLKLLEDNNIKYENYFPYFTQWDEDIFTKDDNTLEVVHSWLNYPYNVDNSWNATEFNSSTYNYSSLQPDFIFSNPVKNLEKDYFSNLLNLKLKYYKYFNCYNPDDKIERTVLIKKSY